ncbi:colicin E1 family microcin immunity protein [Yersinia alsatica]|uniref:colicin E1 family microcin immunity protein n=1 Tax=Yersinia alsatica TaxID=2890317 RepID=UPI0032EC97F2
MSCFLYPLSKKFVEYIALKFTRREFWQQDFFTSSVGGSMQVILFVFCFIFAIPFFLVYLIFNIFKRQPCKR